MTYKLYPDIKASLIPVSASPFPWYDYVLVSFIIEACVFILLWTLSKCSEFLLPDHSGSGARGGFPQSLLIKATGGLTSRSMPIQDPVVVVWKGLPWLLLIKVTDGSHSEWWAVRLAGQSLAQLSRMSRSVSTIPPFYLMSKGKGSYR